MRCRVVSLLHLADITEKGVTFQMDDWATNDRGRVLAAAFTTIVVVIAFIIQEANTNDDSDEDGGQNESIMSDLIKVVREMAEAIKNPTHWSEILYKRVMEVGGFDNRVLEKVFDYLVEHEKEGKRFMVKGMDMRQAWIERYMSRME
ncbi:hypothetical protein J5N97_012841 [Dioscorea zingiberensis]|uniref:Uncharacterized protein n=1 Tax=Dioscorea zingiberensis TaxID=325984 RepID=A0A9D5CRV0_9LILI|nr:hypothetical protein J5N97_012841 [Dioscorea zingiberensis]